MASKAKPSRAAGSPGFIRVIALLAWLTGGLSAKAESPTEFTSPQSVADVIPSDVSLQTNGKWDHDGVDQASHAISAGALDHAATFQIDVERLEPYHKNGWAYRIKAPDDTVTIQGNKVNCRVWAYLKADEADALNKVHLGEAVTLSGVIERAELRIYHTKPALSLNLKDARVEDASAPEAAPIVAQQHSVSTMKLTEDQARAVVLIKGDNAEGTGFLVKMPDGPVVVTNIHVVSNNPNLKITTNTGSQIAVLSYKGATDRDMILIAIKDEKYSYLELATDVTSTVQPGDEVITPGNSEGGEVMLNTRGKVLGIGPDRVEFDNPVYHGNSGGPVFHVKSGKVIGVVTEAVKVDVSNELDKASFANRHSAISHSMRYFGLRIDTVPKWELYDSKNFLTETAFLDKFDRRSRCLESLLASSNQQKNKKKGKGEDKAEANLFATDPQIWKACLNLNAGISGADSGQRMNAIRQFHAELADVADSDMPAIQQMNNFYSFDQLRAKDEIAYRKALKKELDSMGDNISILGGMARRSD